MNLVNHEIIKDKELFKKCANELLNETFIPRNFESKRISFNYLKSNLNIFEEYFEFLGYKVIHNKVYDIIYILGEDSKNRIKLKKLETIFLLILKWLYLDHQSNINLLSDVIVDVETIIDKYATLQIKSKQVFDQKQFNDFFIKFRKFNLFESIDKDLSKSKARIRILDSIVLAFDGQSIDEILKETVERLETFNVFDTDNSTIEDEENLNDQLQDE